VRWLIPADCEGSRWRVGLPTGTPVNFSVSPVADVGRPAVPPTTYRDARVTHLIGPPPPPPAEDWRTAGAALGAAALIHVQATVVTLPGALDATMHVVLAVLAGNALLFYALRRREVHLRRYEAYQQELMAWAMLEVLVRQEEEPALGWRDAS